MGFVPGAPHEDAVIVGDAMHQIETVARFTDRREVLPLFGDLAPIASDAIDAIMCATFDPRSIVLSKAIQSTRPKWQFEHPTPYRMKVPFRDAVGALRDRLRVLGLDADGCLVELKPNRGRAAMRDGVYDLNAAPRSPLQWGDPSLISIGHARAEYVAWHGALVALAQSLAGKLKEFEPAPPRAMPMPWFTGDAPASRVLPRVADAAGEVQLTLAPKRPAPPAQSRETPAKRAIRLAAAAAVNIRKGEEMAATQG
jgi:hypothetical protein